MKVLIAALLSCAMFYLSQGLDDAWYLAWFAATPLLWLAYGNTPFWQVIAACTAAIVASSIYILQCYTMLPPMVIAPAVIIQIALFCAAVWFGRFAQRRMPAPVTLFAFPALWTAVEFLLFSVSPNGTYGSLAYSQVSAPFLIQSASLFGIYSITFLICLCANTLAMAGHRKLRTPAVLGAGFGLCALNVAFGLVRLAQPQPETVRVAALVDETAMDKTWRSHSQADAVAVADTYARAIRSAAAQGAKFAVTPEGGIVSDPEWQAAVMAPLATVARETGTQVIAGVVYRKPPADIAVSLAPDGTMRRYDKRHPVPGLEDRFTPGHVSGVLGQGRAMEICKDMDFPITIRRDAAMGVRLVGSPAGDFGKDAWLHGRMAVLRGVEDGFALVRAANEGLVTASDAEGRLIASKMDTPTGLTMVIADLPLGPGPTLYTRIGDAFAWLCVALTLGIGALALLRRRT